MIDIESIDLDKYKDKCLLIKKFLYPSFIISLLV